jgi:hypothetical protein
MRQLSAAGQQTIDDVARRHGFSSAAVTSMFASVLAGNGRMAQFDHPEFGGAGQWMRGGMTMVSDMFNATLRARVERLCDELSGLIAAQGPGMFVAGPNVESDAWWPANLGRPNAAGGQNGMRYAYFAAARRLAVDSGGDVLLYDTLDHRIGGVSQQQAGHGSLTFSSQHGPVDLATLPRVSGPPPEPGASGPSVSVPPAASVPAANAPDSAAPGAGVPGAGVPDVLATIERLAHLHGRGILSEAEFVAKKTELLSRL